MKLMQFGLILMLIGISAADSPNFLIPAIVILLGMAIAIVGGKHEGIF